MSSTPQTILRGRRAGGSAKKKSGRAGLGSRGVRAHRRIEEPSSSLLSLALTGGRRRRMVEPRSNRTRVARRRSKTGWNFGEPALVVSPPWRSNLDLEIAAPHRGLTEASLLCLTPAGPARTFTRGDRCVASRKAPGSSFLRWQVHDLNTRRRAEPTMQDERRPDGNVGHAQHATQARRSCQLQRISSCQTIGRRPVRRAVSSHPSHTGGPSSCCKPRTALQLTTQICTKFL